jgi:glycolate oxidase FAD binding subunit
VSAPSSISSLQSQISSAHRLLPRGAGTKPALSTPPEGVTALDLSTLSGVLEYDPGEFTFTALAGTPLADVQALLAEHGQYLPFDPPLVQRGATLGGTVAAGLSGPGRYRYGGVRDFILGVKWLNGQGELVRGGGKVVKNAAGFDFPKLFVGSLGQLGVLVEVTFKVFPKPQAFATLRLEFKRVAEALAAVYKLYGSQLDLEALDFRPDARSVTVYARLGGLREALPARLDRLAQLLGGGEVLEGGNDVLLWQTAREFEWVPSGAALVKVPLTPARIPALEVELEKTSAQRRYSAGGQVAWIAWPEPITSLHDLLLGQAISGLVIFGPPGRPLLGAPRSDHEFATRVRQALDAHGRFAGTGD